MIRRLKNKLFIRLLKWFCDCELDQWEMWKFDSKHGKVYVYIGRGPLDGDERGFTELK
jgi:hypothetical protein